MKMNKTLASTIFLFTLSTQVHAQIFTPRGHSWSDGINDPSNMVENLEYDYNNLPKRGSVHEKLAWYASYWPNYKGGIAYREQTGRKAVGYGAYRTLTKQQVLSMTQGQLLSLSPAEKIDIANGNYSFPITTIEKLTNNERDPGWTGICHGVAAAGLHHMAPDATTYTNPDGVKLTFTRNDLKALIANYYADHGDYDSSKYLGKRCFRANIGPVSLSKDCRGTNAGAFHLALTNMVGLQKKPVVADTFRSKQVWNYTIFSYQSVVLKTRKRKKLATNGSVKLITMQTKITYSKDRWRPGKGEVYKYVLELNQHDEIVGGRWISKNRPDFLWTMDKAEFKDDYAVLNNILK